MSDDTQNSDQKKIYTLYALLGVSIVLSVIPNATAGFLSLVFLAWCLAVSYSARGAAQEHSLVENHAIYIIRTLWITVLLSVVTLIAAVAYMLGRVDYSPFESCAQSIGGQGIEALEQMSTTELYALAGPCMDSFIALNSALFNLCVLIAGGPLIVYMAYRFIKGVSRAAKGYRLAAPKAWL